MVIYVDLLLCYNLLVHFCLLSSTAAISMTRCKKGRLLLGSLLGSVFSFAIFLRFNAAEFMLLKFLMAVLLILTAFGFGNLRLFVRRILLFLAVNLVYAGAMMAVALGIAPAGMVYRSGVAYFGGDTVSYVLGLLLGYLLLRGFVWFLARKKGERRHYPVKVRCGEKTAEFVAFYDSGNRAVDPYSGRPVLFLAPETARQILPEQLLPAFVSGRLDEAVLGFGHKVRLLPVDTVSGSRMTLSFVPDEILVDGNERCDWCAAVTEDALGCEAQGLLPASF